MVRRILASVAIMLCAALAAAQTTGDRINSYFGDWHSSTPRTTHGSLVERDIFTRGDPQNPAHQGAVLRYLNAYTYATLAPHATTKATRLDGQQEIYFCCLRPRHRKSRRPNRRSVSQHRDSDAGEPRVHAEEHRRSAADHVCDQRSDASRLSAKFDHAGAR